jgi:ATP-binding cassette subfamily B protein
VTAMRERLTALAFVLALGPRADRLRAILVAAIAILQQATGIGLAVLLGQIAGAAVRRSTAGIVAFSVLAAIFVLLTQGAFLAGYFTRLRLREEMERNVEARLITVLGTTPTLEIHERGDLRDQAANVRSLRSDLGQSFDTTMMLAGAVLLLIASTVLLATIVPALAALPLFAVPALLATQRTERKRGEAVLRMMPLTRLARHLFTLATAASSGREVRLFGLANELERRHREQWDRAGRDILRAEAPARAVVALAWFLFVAAYGTAMLLIARAGLDGSASLSEIVTAIAVMAQISGQVQMVLTWLFWVLQALRGASSYLRIVEQGASERRNLRSASATAVPRGLTDGITLEKLTFRYWQRDEPSLRDVSVHLPAGAVVALVGENGVGKTTLVKLLCRFYNPTAGRILVDGADMAGFDPDAWRSRVTAAFQDFARFEMTVRDVVGLGDLPHREDQDRVLASLDQVGGGTLVRSLPDGLETRLGRSWDGADLSGGQWQMLANARAAMRQTPLLRILDEPTSSLDARAEERLFQQYAEQSRAERCVTILVTHRFTTARAADLIIVLSAGQVAEVGNHETLRQAGGLYAELFDLQARYYT